MARGVAYYGDGADRQNLAEARREINELKKQLERLGKTHRETVSQLAEAQSRYPDDVRARREIAAALADPDELAWHRESAWLAAGAEIDAIPPSGWPDTIAEVEGGVEQYVAGALGYRVELYTPTPSSADAPRPRATFLGSERERIAAAQAPVEQARKAKP
jgi:hypothetical protein